MSRLLRLPGRRTKPAPPAEHDDGSSVPWDRYPDDACSAPEPLYHAPEHPHSGDHGPDDHGPDGYSAENYSPQDYSPEDRGHAPYAPPRDRAGADGHRPDRHDAYAHETYVHETYARDTYVQESYDRYERRQNVDGHETDLYAEAPRGGHLRGAAAGRSGAPPLRA